MTVNNNLPPSGDSGDRTAAAGINFMTVLLVLIVLAVVGWFLFNGLARYGTAPATNSGAPAQQAPNINVQPNIKVEPQQPAQPQPTQPQQPAQPGNGGY